MGGAIIEGERPGYMKAIFIDRDGVINKDPGGWTKYNYVTDWKDFHFLPGALEALKILEKNGIRVIVVSNQAGVSRGYFSEGDLEKVNTKMLQEIEKSGGHIEEVYYCIHKDEDDCDCRKPKTGLFEKAIAKHHIDPKDTYIIGDSMVDISAGKRIECRTVFVLSGKTSKEEMEKWVDQPDYVFEDLLSVVKWLMKENGANG